MPEGIVDKYDIPENQGIFDNDGLSDRLIYRSFPEDYNAANPVTKETIKGVCKAFVKVNRDYYQLEATSQDKRAAYRYILRDLLNAGGNLSLYNFDINLDGCHEPLIVMEDYHELDSYEDEQQGYTQRVGVLNVESLKGSFRKKGTNINYNQGCKIVFTHTHQIVLTNLIPYLPQH